MTETVGAIPGRNSGYVQPLDCVPGDDATTVKLSDGREFLDVNMALKDEDVERIKTGWVCIRCLEPQSEAFPETCEMGLRTVGQRLCNFPMREKQAEEFAIMYKGSVKIGSHINPADEMERLKQIDEYEQRTGLILPPSVRNKI